MSCPSSHRVAIGCLAIAVTALVSVAAPLRGAEAAAANANIVIGLLLPPEETEATSLRDGALLGVSDANETTGVLARLIIRGRVGQWGADAVEAARMVTDDGARGLIAPADGSASHLALQVSGRTATPVVSLCADSSVSRAGVPWMVRVVPRTVDEARALFAGIQVHSTNGATRWAAVVPDGRPGRELARDLKEAAAASGCLLETPFEAKSPLTNAAAIAGQILKGHASVVALWLDPATAGILVKSLRAAGFAGRLAGPGRLRSAGFAAAAGEAVEGFVVGRHGRSALASSRWLQFSPIGMR